MKKLLVFTLTIGVAYIEAHSQPIVQSSEATTIVHSNEAEVTGQSNDGENLLEYLPAHYNLASRSYIVSY